MVTIITVSGAEKRNFRKETRNMMPLCFADTGEENTIKRVGGSPEVRQHLETLGFVVGANVSVVNSFKGNLIIKVKESRVAVDEEMARKIMI